MTLETAITEVKRLRMEAGDILVFHLERLASDAEMERMIQRLKTSFGEDAPILILEPGIDIAVINSADLKRGWVKAKDG